MKTIISVLILCSIIIYFGCAGKLSGTVPPTDNTSVSEIVAGVVSGVVNASSSIGTNASWSPKKASFFAEIRNILNPVNTAEAQSSTPTPSLGTCPTIPAGGTGCTGGGTVETFVYNNCSLPVSTTIWNGSQSLVETKGTTALACGSFPSFVANDTVVRKFGPQTYRLTPPSQFIVLADTSAPTGGETIVFDGTGGRTITINGIHISGDVFSYVLWDYTISSSAVVVPSGPLTIPLGTAITVQDNKNQDVATSTFIVGATFTSGCCLPTAGTLSTVYAKSGKTETLIFSAAPPCGSATLNSKPIVMTNCF